MTFSIRFTESGLPIKNLEKQTRYAMSLTINRSLEEARDRSRQRVHQVFTIRSASSGRYLERLIDVRERAKRESLRGVVSIEDPAFGKGNQGAAHLLIKHEVGGRFTRDANQNPFAIPTRSLRGSRAQVIPRGLYPTALGFSRTNYTIPVQDFHRAKQTRGGVVLRGKRRTFAVDQRFHPASPIGGRGVWQRRGRGSGSDTFLLWHYASSITLRPTLRFMETAERTINERMGVNFPGFLDLALRTAR